jgi:hypothetical protein
MQLLLGPDRANYTPWEGTMYMIAGFITRKGRVRRRRATFGFRFQNSDKELHSKQRQ